MRLRTLFIDLDDTLYPKESGLWSAIRQRMTDYMREQLGFPPEVIPKLRQHYFDTYGTTLRGLQIHYHVDPDRYLAYVHDLPLEEFIAPDPQLHAILSSLPQEKWIFTNADANHARRVLARLGLEDCFTGIIDVCALGYICKPHREAYLRAMRLAGADRPEECLLFDDSPRNLMPARELGMMTVLVLSGQPVARSTVAGTKSDPSESTLPGSSEAPALSSAEVPAADFTLLEWNQLPSLIPELWNQAGSSPGRDGKN